MFSATAWGCSFIRDFLDPELCARCRLDALAAPGVRSLVAHADAGQTMDEDIRQSVHARVANSTVALIEARFATLMPELERHFLVKLRGWQTPQFLIYRVGDKFQPHRDRQSGMGSGNAVAGEHRKVSMVIFLNGQAEDGEETFGGGYLTFYGSSGGAELSDAAHCRARLWSLFVLT